VRLLSLFTLPLLGLATLSATAAAQTPTEVFQRYQATIQDQTRAATVDLEARFDSAKSSVLRLYAIGAPQRVMRQFAHESYGTFERCAEGATDSIRKVAKEGREVLLRMGADPALVHRLGYYSASGISSVLDAEASVKERFTALLDRLI
jgi:hypothetical protein